jgi:hypothetical protein
MPAVEERWRWSEEQMIDNTQSHGEFTRDLPEFENTIHMDSKTLVANGLIYLHEKDDPATSTYFYSTGDGKNPIRSPGGFGDGWMHFNDYDCWHGTKNESNGIRYTLLVPLSLNKFLKF